jgi:hypothetical protein
MFEAFDLCCCRPCVVSIHDNLAFKSFFVNVFSQLLIAFVMLFGIPSLSNLRIFEKRWFTSCYYHLLPIMQLYATVSKVTLSANLPGEHLWISMVAVCHSSVQ